MGLSDFHDAAGSIDLVFRPNKIEEAIRISGFTGAISSIENISSGMLNTVYRIKFCSQDQDLILRIRSFQHPEYGQEFAAERYAYHLIDGLGIRAPKLHHFCLRENPLGYPFAVFDFEEGQTLDVVLSSPSVSQETKLNALKVLGENLSKVHKVKGPGYGTLTSIWCSRDERRQFWNKMFTAEQERLMVEDIEAGGNYTSLINEWTNVIADLPDFLGEPRLIHGDVHGRNIIITESGNVSLIDWEASRFRIAPYDFAQIRYLNLKDDHDGWEALIDSYIDASNYKIDKKQLEEAINVCETFWRLRMGLFQKKFSIGEGSYFGYADDHISYVKKCISVNAQNANLPYQPHLK